MRIATFPAGAFRTNCYIVSSDDSNECMIIDPGQDAHRKSATLSIPINCIQQVFISPTAMQIMFGILQSYQRNMTFQLLFTTTICSC